MTHNKITVVAKESKYYFTFGIASEAIDGTELCDRFVEVKANSLDHAKQIMHRHWHKNWAKVYSEAEAKWIFDAVERGEMEEIPLEFQTDPFSIGKIRYYG